MNASQQKPRAESNALDEPDYSAATRSVVITEENVENGSHYAYRVTTT